MTNEEAIKYVTKRLHCYDPVEDEIAMEKYVAKVFLCEDIVDMGVDTWVDTPISELLFELQELLDQVAIEQNDHIKDAVAMSKSTDEQLMSLIVDDEPLRPDTDTCLKTLRKSMMRSITAMVLYAQVYNDIRDKFKSQR